MRRSFLGTKLDRADRSNVSEAVTITRALAKLACHHKADSEYFAVHSALRTKHLTDISRDADLLRAELLRFDSTIPWDRATVKRFEQDSEHGDQPDESAFCKKDMDTLNSSEKLIAKQQKKDILASQDAADLFAEMDYESEADWVNQLNYHFFKPYKKTRAVDWRQQDE